MTKSLRDEMGAERFDAAMAEGVRKAVAELHAAGLPAIGGENGRVYKDYADGTRVYVDEEDPGTPAYRIFADGTKVFVDEADTPE